MKTQNLWGACVLWRSTWLESNELNENLTHRSCHCACPMVLVIVLAVLRSSRNVDPLSRSCHRHSRLRLMLLSGRYRWSLRQCFVLAAMPSPGVSIGPQSRNWEYWIKNMEFRNKILGIASILAWDTKNYHNKLNTRMIQIILPVWRWELFRPPMLVPITSHVNRLCSCPAMMSHVIGPSCLSIDYDHGPGRLQQRPTMAVHLLVDWVQRPDSSHVELERFWFFLMRTLIYCLHAAHLPLYKSTLLIRFCGGGGVRRLFLRSSGNSHADD